MDRSKQVLKLVTLAAALSLSACVVAPYQPAPRPVYAPQPQPVYQPPPPAYQPPPQAAQAQDYEGDPNAGDVAETANEPPPPLPDYDQPPCPDDGYLWTPGYWHWSPAGYYWVPGTWVQPPQVGFLWTPGYWAFVGGVYAFHGGYWGPHVGYYGGVNYGFGYVGVGYGGGRWEGNRFAYNTAVVNVNRTVIHNTYNETIVNNVTINHVSYNGGPNGVRAAPTPQERSWSREQHVPPTSVQVSHVQEANRNPALFAHANGGHPGIAATARPAAFSGPGVISAHGAAPIGNQGGRPGALPPANNSNNLGAQAAAARQLQSNQAQGAPRGQAPAAPTVQQRAYVGKPQTQLAQPPAAGAPKTGGAAPNSGKPPPPHPDKNHEGERDK
jgi:WXXGXW repeat (2 copies)